MDLLRSLLMVPARDTALLAAASRTSADAIVLDLEDGTPPAEAAEARKAAHWAAAELRSAHRQVWVRVHGTGTLLVKADIEATICEDVRGYILPHTQSANHVRYTEALLRDAERAAGIKEGASGLIALIGSAEGLLNAREIAGASPRMVALGLDGTSLSADMGVDAFRDVHVYLYPRGHIAVCARAANVLGLDTPYFLARETQGLLSDATLARGLGLHGKFVIAPEQASVVNAVFRPSGDEVAYARRLAAEHQEAVERGDDHVFIDGRIIDAPRARRAERLIELASAIESKEQQAAV